MAWKGIVGKSFTPDAFEDYVATLKFSTWRPRFVVVHNTAVPNRKTWDGWQTRNPPITDEKWAQNLVGFYRDTQRWSSGPHLFVTPAGILVFSHLTDSGTHSPAWNSISWGVETVGDFGSDKFEGSIRDNLIAALATLHAAAGLQLLPYARGVGGLHFHKEDPKTTHKNCPGKNMGKAALIKAVHAEIERRHGGEHPADEGGNVGVVKTDPNDPLNMREAPAAKANVVATLQNGTNVTVLGARNVGTQRWLNVTAVNGSGWVNSRFVEIN
jgi:hypothetical protein